MIRLKAVKKLRRLMRAACIGTIPNQILLSKLNINYAFSGTLAGGGFYRILVTSLGVHSTDLALNLIQTVYLWSKYYIIIFKAYLSIF